MTRENKRAALAFLAALLITSTVAPAAEVTRTFEFALDKWHDLDAGDGPVTLYRVRLEKAEGRLTKSTIARPYNQEYLQTLRLQLEYTNEASSKWKARVTARWLDDDGQVIDGISANETLDRKSARKVSAVSVSTLKYGLEQATTLEVSVHYEP